MSKRRVSRSTLERRARLTFGLFILLTVVACLSWPWWQMERLVRSGDPDRAQTYVQAYLQSLHAIGFMGDDKSAEREQLKRFRTGGGQQAKLIRIQPAKEAGTQAPPPDLTPFEAAAVDVFLKHPEEKGYWQTSGNTFYYVQGLRVGTECLACHSDYKAGELKGAVALGLDITERNKTLLANRLVLLVAALLVMMLSMAVLYALFRYMVVRPVQHLRDVADRVSDGDVQVRSEIDTGNELEALSDALNHMLDQLAKTQAELRAANESRDAKLDELAKANVALFEMNQVKTKFLTTMSHELRTPLNSILGFAQIISEAPAVEQDPKLARYANNILSSGRMLLEMINDLLDLAKIEAGRVEARCEKVTPQDLAEVAANMVRPMLAETPLRFVVEVDDSVPIMMTDATKVQQILYNLLANAIKFTQEGEVRLTARPAEDGMVAFTVSDTGAGIAREQQLRIFDRFTQLDSSYTRRYRGTGLGLSIVKELTGVLGGSVSVESELGRGSAFTVLLPVDSSPAAGPQGGVGAGAKAPDAGPARGET